MEALLAQGRDDEAAELVADARQADAGDAVAPKVRARCAHARLLARRGEGSHAEALSGEAVELTRDTDDLDLQGDAWLALAEVAENHEAAAEALRRFERKGNLVSAARARGLLRRLRPEGVDESAPRSSSLQ